jgi:hypothetical protein
MALRVPTTSEDQRNDLPLNEAYAKERIAVSPLHVLDERTLHVSVNDKNDLKGT